MIIYDPLWAHGSDGIGAESMNIDVTCPRVQTQTQHWWLWGKALKMPAERMVRVTTNGHK